MSKKHDKGMDSIDRSVPGYSEASIWPIEPKYPEEIMGVWLYRDGTVEISIKGVNGLEIPFFFDNHLGRLFFGKNDLDSNAAFIKKGSAFEREVYDYLETARKKLNTVHFDLSDIKLFNDCFEKAKVYSGV